MSLSALLTSCYLIKAFDFLVISLHLQKLNDSQQDNVQTLDKVQLYCNDSLLKCSCSQILKGIALYNANKLSACCKIETHIRVKVNHVQIVSLLSSLIILCVYVIFVRNR